MATLYVETSLPMSAAMGRDPDAMRLLQSVTQAQAPPQPLAHQIVVPAACLMEAFSAFQRQRSQHNQFSDDLRRWAVQLRRDVTSGAAAAMLRHVVEARGEANRLLDDMQSRLALAVEELCRGAVVIPVEPGVVLDSLRAQHLRQMTDNLILHAVLADARARPAGRKALLTGNTNDFEDPQVLALLQAAGVEGPLSTAGEALEWLAAGP